MGRVRETVSEFFVNPKSCHDINAETEPTGCRVLLQLAVDSKQPLYGAGLKPALGKISKERATILADKIILRQFQMPVATKSFFWRLLLRTPIEDCFVV